MSTGYDILPVQRSSGPNPADVLALVTTAIPLPQDTIRALRLTCRTTRLAIDDSVTELMLSNAAANGLRATDNPLTSGLMSLQLDDTTYSYPGLLNVCTMALNNSTDLKRLVLYTWLTVRPFGGVHEMPSSDAHVALGMLRTCSWPSLESLTIFGVLNIFYTIIRLESVPKLAELRLTGPLDRNDITAIHQAPGLAGRLEVLDLGGCSIGFHPGDFVRLGRLLEETSRLRVLKVGCSWCSDVAFLARPELASLEVLEFLAFNERIVLDSDVAFTPKARLHTISFKGMRARADTLRALLCRGWALPALQHLGLHLNPDDWSVLSALEPTTLKSLELSRCTMLFANLSHVAAALARLPALETLKLAPRIEVPGGQVVHFDAVIWSLFSNAALQGVTFHSLRRLQTGGAVEDDDESLMVLIEYAKVMPQLEEIVMENCQIGADGVASLAAAGCAGLWPNLRLFRFRHFHGDDEESCVRELRTVWPEMVVEIGPVGDDE